MSTARGRSPVGVGVVLAVGLVSCGAPLSVDPSATAVPWLDLKHAPVTATLSATVEDGVLLYEVPSNVPGITGRPVVVILPPGYGDAANAQRRYPVLYLGDGNNVLSWSAFGHGGWEVPAASRALSGVKTEPVIVVCPYHGGSKRRAEYTQSWAETTPDGATPERYLDWVQYNLMPFVDGQFRTLMDANQRGIGGSSSAAILALYAAWTRPDVYRRVIAMSTFHWDIERFIPQIEAAPSKPPLRRVYLDSGSPTDGVTEMTRIAEALTARGFVPGQDLQTFIGENHQHNEAFWRLRFPGALEFTWPLGGP